MILKTSHANVLRRFLLALVMTGALLMASQMPVSAQDLNPSDYFNLSYEPVTFDRSEINGDEVFHAVLTGKATCTKDLPVPLPVSGVVITSQVVAEHSESGATVTLNPGFNVSIEPFPSKQGDEIDISQTVPLQFPAEAEPGEYSVIGKIKEGHINLVLGSLEITSYLPPEQLMGTVKYTIATPAPAPESTPAPAPEAEPEPEITEQPPVSKGAPAPGAIKAPEEAETGYPGWFWLVVVLAAGTTIFNIFWFLKNRRD